MTLQNPRTLEAAVDSLGRAFAGAGSIALHQDVGNAPRERAADGLEFGELRGDAAADRVDHVVRCRGGAVRMPVGGEDALQTRRPQVSCWTRCRKRPISSPARAAT